MFKKSVVAIVSVVLVLTLLCTGAMAEVQYSWNGEFPAVPELQHRVYRKAGTESDPDALVASLWSGKKYSCEVKESCISYTLAASESDSGFRENADQWDDGMFAYRIDRTKWPEQTDIGGADAAYARMEDWLAGWLPAEWYAVRGINFGSFDEDGNPVDHYYSLTWPQMVEPGVAAYGAGVRVECYSGIVDSAYISRSTFVPADGDASEYLTAQQALQSLNFAVANIDPEHVCTTFDDPEDRLVAIDAVMSNKFNEDEIYTLCWQFTIQDARKGFVRTVLVDAVSGDIYDEHDGRLDGCF